MVQLLGLDWCFQCGTQIETEAELSVEHAIPWQDSEDPIKLFYDTTNIAFSHRSCNCGAARKPTKKECPSQQAYFRGCRCEGCKSSYSAYRKMLRQRKIDNSK